LAAELGHLAIPKALDISRPQDVESTCKEIRNKHGAVSVIVNNAGVLSNHKLEKTSSEEWRKIMSVNLDGAFHLSRQCLPDMKAQKWGRIVNSSSLAAKTGGLTAGTAYTVSKGGLSALTLSVAREAAPFRVTVNAVTPAYIKTPMITDFLTDEQKHDLLQQIPVGRFCEAEEVAHLIHFLASSLEE
jgi:3-oxoacyl-[acyl-carrier protein] reductase